MSDTEAQQLLDGAARCAREGVTAAAIVAARAALSEARSKAMIRRCRAIVDAYESGTANMAREKMRVRRAPDEAARAAGGGQ